MFDHLLLDIADFSTVSTSTDAGGQETKSVVTLFSNVKCRLEVSNQFSVKDDAGAGETFRDKFKLIVLPAFGTANRGDKVVINTQNYVIAGVKQELGPGGGIDHTVYTIEELDNV